jgi:hypothetical protein
VNCLYFFSADVLTGLRLILNDRTLPNTKRCERRSAKSAGVVPGSGKNWSEAIAFRLEYRLGRLWFILEPTIKIHREPGTEPDEDSREFIRERMAARYNWSLAILLEAWTALLFGGQTEREFRAFGIADGIDAAFRLSSVTALSRRLPS